MIVQGGRAHRTHYPLIAHSVEQNERLECVGPEFDVVLVRDVFEGQAEVIELFGLWPLLVELAPGLPQFPKRAGPSSRT